MRATRSLNFRQSGEEILPQRAIAALYEATKGRNPIITTEVGQHQMWAAQHFHFDDPNKWLTSGGLGTMGRSEEHTSELQSLMRNSYAVFCLKKKTKK